MKLRRARSALLLLVLLTAATASGFALRNDGRRAAGACPCVNADSTTMSTALHSRVPANARSERPGSATLIRTSRGPVLSTESEELLEVSGTTEGTTRRVARRSPARPERVVASSAAVLRSDICIRSP